jgi:hypothetical protein
VISLQSTDVGTYDDLVNIPLNRLIAARHLIDGSGQELSAIPTPLAVAQKVLLVHDAAELAFLALAVPGSKLGRYFRCGRA